MLRLPGIRWNSNRLSPRRDFPKLSAVGDDVEQPVGSLPDVADALAPIGEQVLLTDDAVILDDEPYELCPAQCANKQVAAPLGEGVARVELGARRCDDWIPEVDRLLKPLALRPCAFSRSAGVHNRAAAVVDAIRDEGPAVVLPRLREVQLVASPRAVFDDPEASLLV